MFISEGDGGGGGKINFLKSMTTSPEQQQPKTIGQQIIHWSNSPAGLRTLAYARNLWRDIPVEKIRLAVTVQRDKIEATAWNLTDADHIRSYFKTQCGLLTLEQLVADRLESPEWNELPIFGNNDLAWIEETETV